jgi:hypothetical protein
MSVVVELFQTAFLILCFVAVPVLLWFLWRIAPTLGRIEIALCFVLAIGVAIYLAPQRSSEDLARTSAPAHASTTP